MIERDPIGGDGVVERNWFHVGKEPRYTAFQDCHVYIGLRAPSYIASDPQKLMPSISFQHRENRPIFYLLFVMSSNNLRARPTANKPHEPTSDNTLIAKHREYEVNPDSDKHVSRTPTILDIIHLLLGLLLLSTTLSYLITSDSLTWGYRPPWTRPARIRAWLVSSSAPFHHPFPINPTIQS